MKPILMTEEFWANSHFSVARYYGEVKVNDSRYVIVDKLGRTLLECSMKAAKEGRDKAIEPGEPADLIREDFQKLYRKLGRDKFIKILEANPGISSPKQMNEIIKSGDMHNRRTEQ